MIGFVSSLILVLSISWFWYFRSNASGEPVLQAAYNESQPISSRVSAVKKLAQTGQKDFDGIKLPGANLSGLGLDHASFRSAVLKAAAFRKTDLRSCDFSGADLSGADLTDANLSECVLRNTDLTQADLSHTDLRGADLTGANVLPDQLNDAITDSKTTGAQVNSAPVNILQPPPSIGVTASKPTSPNRSRPSNNSNTDSIPVIPPQKPGMVTMFFNNWNDDTVQNVPNRPTRFQIAQPYTITDIVNYHWNNGNGAVPRKDSIALRRLDGFAKFPPCYVEGVEGKGSVPNAAWECHPNWTIPPGVYEVVDSSPRSWSQNDASGNKGFSRITGFVAERLPRY